MLKRRELGARNGEPESNWQALSDEMSLRLDKSFAARRFFLNFFVPAVRQAVDSGGKPLALVVQVASLENCGAIRLRLSSYWPCAVCRQSALDTCAAVSLLSARFERPGRTPSGSAPNSQTNR
jgi:hypothetical protein